jgi:hypothetical protein
MGRGSRGGSCLQKKGDSHNLGFEESGAYGKGVKKGNWRSGKSFEKIFVGGILCDGLFDCHWNLVRRLLSC